jgi:hypothetical protein
MSYRYILQYIDLKMTERIPFQFVNQSAKLDDIDRLIDHLMMRECLASLLVKIPGLQINAEAVIAKERFAVSESRRESDGECQIGDNRQ